MLLDKATALTFLAKSEVLDGHHCNERIVVVGLQEIDVLMLHAGHFHRLRCRLHEARGRDVWQRSGAVVIVIDLAETAQVNRFVGDRARRLS